MSDESGVKCPGCGADVDTPGPFCPYCSHDLEIPSRHHSKPPRKSGEDPKSKFSIENVALLVGGIYLLFSIQLPWFETALFEISILEFVELSRSFGENTELLEYRVSLFSISSLIVVVTSPESTRIDGLIIRIAAVLVATWTIWPMLRVFNSSEPDPTLAFFVVCLTLVAVGALSVVQIQRNIG